MRIATFAIVCTVISHPSIAGVKMHVPRAGGREYLIAFPMAASAELKVGVVMGSRYKQSATITTPDGAHGIVNFDEPHTTRSYVGGFRIQRQPEVVHRGEA